MYIIAGLGNPTAQYEGTRHNVGFDVIDVIAKQYNISVDVRKSRAFIGKGMIEGQKVILVKPQTYMNLSGESIRGLVDYYKIDPENELVVIYDDVSLDVGQLRIRIKVGVGEKPKKYDLADYVLGHFSKGEKEQMEEGYHNAMRAVELMLTGRIDEAMNEYNRKVTPKET